MTKERDRIDALLVEEATAGLGNEQQKELERLLAAHADVDRYAFERAAALVFLSSYNKDTTSMPQDLYSRIVADSQGSIGDSE